MGVSGAQATTQYPMTGHGVVAVLIYRFNKVWGTDELFLEERRVPAIDGKTVGFPGGKIERDELSGLIETSVEAMRREVAEELVFKTASGLPFTPPFDLPIAVTDVAGIGDGPVVGFTVFTLRIPHDSVVGFSTEYQRRVVGGHWRRRCAIEDSTDDRQMICTKHLLAAVPFPPSISSRPFTLTLGAPLPSSGRAPKRQRTVQISDTAVGALLQFQCDASPRLFRTVFGEDSAQHLYDKFAKLCDENLLKLWAGLDSSNRARFLRHLCAQPRA